MEDGVFVNDGSIFLDWIDVNKIDKILLSLNINVHHLADKYPYLINWQAGSYNKTLIPYFGKYKEELCWFRISQYTECIDFILKNRNKINYYGLSSNLSDKAKSLFKDEEQRWEYNTSIFMSIGKRTDAFDNINWNGLIVIDPYWSDLSLDPNPESLEILKNNQDKIDYAALSQNPGIFQPDYKIYMKKSKEKTRIFYQELIAKSLHPKRIIKHLDAGMDIDDL